VPVPWLYFQVVIILKSPEIATRSGCFCQLETEVTIARPAKLRNVLMDLSLLAPLSSLKQVTSAGFVFIHVPLLFSAILICPLS
jgi:hypothetical protein